MYVYKVVVHYFQSALRNGDLVGALDQDKGGQVHFVKCVLVHEPRMEVAQHRIDNGEAVCERTLPPLLDGARGEGKQRTD